MKESKPYTLKEIWPIIALISILLIIQIVFFLFDNDIDKFSISSYTSIISHTIILIITLLSPRYAAWRIQRKKE